MFPLLAYTYLIALGHPSYITGTQKWKLGADREEGKRGPVIRAFLREKYDIG